MSVGDLENVGSNQAHTLRQVILLCETVFANRDVVSSDGGNLCVGLVKSMCIMI